MEADDVYAVLSRKIKNMQESGVTGYNETPGTPVGEIISYMGITAPDNYLICDGTEYQIAEYPYLAQHFADHFGTSKYFGGDGVTTFAVPDLRGEFLRGSGTGARNTGTGANVGRHQDATSHAYITSFTAGTGMFLGYKSTTEFARSLNQDTVERISRPYKSQNFSTTLSDTADARFLSYTSRPTNTAVLYCIKYKPTHFAQVQSTYSLQERRVGHG